MNVKVPAVAVLALALTLTACGSDSSDATVAPESTTASAAPPSASPSPSPLPDAGPALAKAVAATRSQSFSFSLTSGSDSLPGEYDAATKGTRLRSPDPSDTDEMVAIGNDLWVQVEPKTYLHYTVTKFTKDQGLVVLGAPVAALDFLTTARDVTMPGADEYRGVLDLTKTPSANPASAHLGSILAQRIGAPAAEIVFTAKVDAQGRIVQCLLTLPNVDTDGKDSTYTFAASDFGKRVSVKKPTGNIVKAPAGAYG
ncbi:hypothetical protein AB0C02_21395 [Micromonospora sp. NPDC048999]|uniref:hypothetical protein n=1 Tax=Micromonospora sp. NPDC048999 TaxID=3155391 RepID=UPI0033DDAE75